MNWYKKSQQLLQVRDWNRFAEDFPEVPWKLIIKMKLGNPPMSFDEIRKVKREGFLDEIVNPDDPKQFPDLARERRERRERRRLEPSPYSAIGA